MALKDFFAMGFSRAIVATFFSTALAIFRGSRHKPGECFDIMLGLRNEIGGDELRHFRNHS